MPYREPTPDPVSETLLRAAALERARDNLRRWRDALVGVTAAAGFWPYLHVRPLAVLHLGAAALAGACAFETWRLGRALAAVMRSAASLPPRDSP